MKNILKYNEYLNCKNIEMNILVNEGKKKDGGIRGWYNHRKSEKIAAELQEEIDMSKGIMDGIKQGLDTLSNDFGDIKKSLDDKDKKVSGEKQKLLDSITAIIEKSKKSTWDINELIDEGEIDYAGYVGNVAIASTVYFGVLLSPFRTRVIMHKGYNYFFTLIKNTIRKALVMLQLNFDQFENLIIYQSFVSADYIRDMDMSSEIASFYEKMTNSLFNDKTGTMKKAKDHRKMEDAMKAFKQKFDTEMKLNKSRRDNNPYTMLDGYNNTYTKSLETLRGYAQDDVQKHLDAIKNSMAKLAGQDVDLQIYSELLIAAAEEHAFKVSTSIYNRFAKMTEVFSLPNQKKMIDLIQGAAVENERIAKENKNKFEEEIKEKTSDDKLEDKGKSIFEDDRFGGKLGEMNDNFEYSIKSMGRWESEDIINDTDELTDDEKHNIKIWLLAHPEILSKCHRGIQVSVVDKNNYDSETLKYVDSLIDIVQDALNEIDVEDVDENIIKSFDNFCILNEAKLKKSEKLQIIRDANDFPDLVKKILGGKLTLTKKTYNRLKSYPELLSSDGKSEWCDKMQDQLKLILDAIEEREKSNSETKTLEIPIEGSNEKIVIPKDENIKPEKSDNKSKKMRKDYMIDFSQMKDSKSKDEIQDMYSDDSKNIAKIALNTIGDDILDDKSFSKRSERIVDAINDAIKNKNGKVSINKNTYDILKDGILKLEKIRNHDYVQIENTKKEESEK